MKRAFERVRGPRNITAGWVAGWLNINTSTDNTERQQMIRYTSTARGGQ